MKTYTVFHFDGTETEVMAEKFAVENGALVFVDLSGKRIRAIAPGTWESVSLTEED